MATVIIPLLLKPSSISLGVRMPTQRKNTTTVRRTIPGRILSHTKLRSCRSGQQHKHYIKIHVFTFKKRKNNKKYSSAHSFRLTYF